MYTDSNKGKSAWWSWGNNKLHGANYPLSVRLNCTRLLLPSATKLRRLRFYTCLSVHGGGESASVHAGIPPPRSRKPLRADPPGASPPRSRHPPRSRLPPDADTPEQTPPLGADPSPWSRHPPRRLLLRTVRILLECILVNRYIVVIPIIHRVGSALLIPLTGWS